MNNPIRTCIACRKKDNKDLLIKIVKQKDNAIIVSNSNKVFGRSVYVCNCENCIEKVCKNKLINKSFKQNVNEQVYKELKSLAVKE